MLPNLCRVAMTMMAVAAPVLAHGGQFRGPPAGPLTPGGGPVGPKSPGARTGGLGGIGGPTSWMSWWEYNKAPFLRLREAIHDPGTVEASDNQVKLETLAPDLAMKRDMILPQLVELADKASSRDVQTACLIAAAKIGVDHREFELLPILTKRLTRGDQEIRETAALSLGVTRRRDALPILFDLATNSRGARRLVKREEVSERTRAFAIYGIGLAVERDLDLPSQRKAFAVLSGLLEEDDRDIQVAALQALSVLNVDLDTPGHKRLLWQVTEKLWEFYGRDVGRAREMIQAHASTSVARLLGRGESAEHERAKRMLARELTTKRKRRSPPIQQSAVIALGKLVQREERHPGDAQYTEVLQKYAKEGGDQLARFLCLMSLAEIGGASNRDFLHKMLREGGKATERPWAALGLGVLAFYERTAPGGVVDTTTGKALKKQLREVKTDTFRAAAAVALGLTGYPGANKELTKLLDKNRMNEVLRGYIAIGFALMDAKEMIPKLRSVVADSKHMPLLMMQASIALGKLGDKDAIKLLSKVLKKGNANVARLSGIATAFRYIGDRRAVAELIKLLKDRELTKLSRAFVAAALGGVSDANMLPWNSIYSIGTNYRARVSTLSGAGTGVLDIL